MIPANSDINLETVRNSFSRRELWYGPLRLASRYLLSPLAGYTNLPFRRIVRELGGVGLCTTDLINARALLERRPKALEMVETGPFDSPLAVQIFGHDAQEMGAAARMLEERGIHSIDINMGCPVHHVTNNGAGAMLMCRPESTLQLVRGVVQAVKIPVTVKMRLGWDEKTITAPDFARAFEELGVVAVAIHGRTREQGFSGHVNLDGIRQVVTAVKHIPVIGNGDIRTIPDAVRMFAVTGCQGISVGRGALANPWIFSQLVEWEQTGEYAPTGTFLERMNLLKRQLAYVVEQKGPERAIPAFRRMAHWYLSAMKVPARLRDLFQQARNLAMVEEALAIIAERGPTVGGKAGPLPEYHIPVPGGPVEHW